MAEDADTEVHDVIRSKEQGKQDEVLDVSEVEEIYEALPQPKVEDGRYGDVVHVEEGGQGGQLAIKDELRCETDGEKLEILLPGSGRVVPEQGGQIINYNLILQHGLSG